MINLLNAVLDSENLVLLMYSQINAVGVAILAVLLLYGLKTGLRGTDIKLFNMLIFSNVFILILDTGMWLIDGKTFAGAYELNVIVSTLYYFMMPVVCFFWLAYCDYRINCEKFSLHFRIYLVILAFFALLAIVNAFTGLIFYVDSANVYHRGDRFAMYAALSFCYIIYASAMAFSQSKKTLIPSVRSECRSMIFFSIPPVAAAIIQSFAYGVSIIWIATVISILVAFLNVQNSRILTDPLTNMNNRRRMDMYLEWITTLPRQSGEHLYMIYIDVDDFKSINDTFGHSVGDSALIQVGSVLKNSAQKGDFVARIAGDEFTYICRRASETELMQVVFRLDEAVHNVNSSGKNPFMISLSMGWASYGENGVDTIDALIAASDAKMYEEKSGKKISV